MTERATTIRPRLPTPAGRRRLTFQLSLLIVQFSLLSACASGPELSASEEAVQQSRQAVSYGVEEGFEESESFDTYDVPGRLNPPRCEAPPYEIYVHGHWVRAWLEADDPTLARIERLLDTEDEASRLKQLILRGDLDGRRQSARGVRYPVFAVEEIVE